MKTIRNTLAALVVAVLLLATASCSADSSTSDNAYTGVCVDPDTNERVPEDRCGTAADDGMSSTGYFWLWYLTASQPRYLPGYGYPVVVSDGYTSIPRGSRHTPAAPAASTKPGYRAPAVTTRPTAKPPAPRPAPAPAPKPAKKQPVWKQPPAGNGGPAKPAQPAPKPAPKPPAAKPPTTRR